MRAALRKIRRALEAQGPPLGGNRSRAQSRLRVVLTMLGVLPLPASARHPVSPRWTWLALAGYVACFAGFGLLLLRMINVAFP